MIFYKIETEISIKGTESNTSSEDKLSDSIQSVSDTIFIKSGSKAFIAPCSIDKNKVVFAAALFDGENVEGYLNDYLREIGADVLFKKCTEVSTKDFFTSVNRAERKGLFSLRKGLSALEVDYISFNDCFIDSAAEKDGLIKAASNLNCYKSLISEIERIYCGARKSGGIVNGNPIHYIIETDSAFVSSQVISILVSALYSNNRISNKRYAIVDDDNLSQSQYRDAEKLFEININGVMAFDITAFSFGNRRYSESACRLQLK